MRPCCAPQAMEFDWPPKAASDGSRSLGLRCGTHRRMSKPLLRLNYSNSISIRTMLLDSMRGHRRTIGSHLSSITSTDLSRLRFPSVTRLALYVLGSMRA
jgi:hypothetical protein